MTEQKWDIAKDRYPKEAEVFENWVNDYMGQIVDYSKLPYDIQKYLWFTFEAVALKVLDDKERSN